MKIILELKIENVDKDSFLRFFHLLQDFINKNVDKYFIKK